LCLDIKASNAFRSVQKCATYDGAQWGVVEARGFDEESFELRGALFARNLFCLNKVMNFIAAVHAKKRNDFEPDS
jgi:hypothetical protein